MTEPKISTVASYTVVQSLGTVVARTAHVTSSVLVDLDENGAVAGIEAIGTSVGVGELLDVIRWLRAPALSAPSEPVPDGPRVWAMPVIPADVGRLTDADGETWYRCGPRHWQPARTHRDYGETELIARRGPLTEVTDAP